MTTTALRQELQGYLAAIPERRLTALKPLLADLANDGADYWKPIIEPASPEEIEMIEEGVREYHEHPETFISLKDFLAERGEA